MQPLRHIVPSPMPFVQNVPLYSSYAGNALIPELFTALIDGIDLPVDKAALQPLWTPLFPAAMHTIGYVFRKRPVREIVLCCPLALVSLASGIALQYFDLPMYSLATARNVPVWIFHALSAVQFGARLDELHLFTGPGWLQQQFDETAGFYYTPFFWVLQAMLLWILVDRWRRRM